MGKFLSDLSILVNEIIDDGSKQISGVQVPYRDETKQTFTNLLAYVRDCTWSENETTRFVCQNFMVGQSNLSEAWNHRFPNKPEKAESSMRTVWQKINSYLGHVFPSDIVEIFVTENTERLKELDKTIEALYFNDRRVESDLGEQLVTELQSLPITTKKYTASECEHEIKVLKRLSAVSYRNIMDTCDMKKLSYVFFELTRPSTVKGEINERRLSFIKAFVLASPDSISVSDSSIASASENVSAVESEESVASDIGITVSGLDSTDSDFEPDNLAAMFSSMSEGSANIMDLDSVLDIATEYCSGISVGEDAVVNPNVLSFLHTVVTRAGILEELSRFPKQDVAYVVSELKNGNSMFMDFVENGVVDNNLEDDFNLVEIARDRVEQNIQGVAPSDNISVGAIQVLCDYMKLNVIRRIDALKPSELARVYYDMVSDEHNDVKDFVDAFVETDLAKYEAEKLSIRHEYINSH